MNWLPSHFPTRWGMKASRGFWRSPSKLKFIHARPIVGLISAWSWYLIQLFETPVQWWTVDGQLLLINGRSVDENMIIKDPYMQIWRCQRGLGRGVEIPQFKYVSVAYCVCSLSSCHETTSLDRSENKYKVSIGTNGLLAIHGVFTVMLQCWGCLQ